HETQFTLILAALITGLVCWIFLGSWNSTFNVLLSIPTSIIGSFFILYFMGFTLNMFTLLALALAIGIVVDDAIMVLENIVRHQQMGKDRTTASLDGAREITFAAVAASTAVAAIFLPVAFMSGIIGKFFFQFGVTISGAVMLSLLEAVTLTPMRASQLLSKETTPGRFEKKVIETFDKIASFYKRWLERALAHRWKVLGFALLIFALSLFVQTLIRKEFIPSQDQSLFILRFQAPVGTSLPATVEKLAVVEEYLKKHQAVKRIFAFTGGQDANSGNIFVSLKPIGERKKSQKALIDEMRADLKKISPLKIVAQDLSTRGFSAQRGYPVEINIRGPDWNVLREKSVELTNRLRATGLAVDIDTDYRLGQPEVRVTPDRAKCALSRVSMQDIGEAIEAAIGSVVVGKFTSEGRRYDVRLSFESSSRTQPSDIENIQIRTPYGQLIPLKNLAQIKTVPTLQTITRINRERSISVTANLAPGKSQPDALAAAGKIAKEILPENYHYYFGGGAQAFQESFSSLWSTLWLGIIIAYMILAAQFNSFVYPVIVLLALPFSLSGAFFGLWATGNSLNLFSMIGIILLMGIVKKNSIRLVEFTNTMREQGLGLRDALLTASPIRLRPILMTSCATIAAALPPALAIGPGAESRIPMSVTVIGGVILSTLFTLFVVPSAYSLATEWIERIFHKKKTA
ncbi:MAG: efflux RND transporter permease subunit, partial [Spirochaetia bacterium]|nr:efflux RND transporter permease subunit [Spirochaetia bacterium]